MVLSKVLLSLAVSYAAALCFYPALRAPGRRRTCIFGCLVTIILLAPLAVPSSARLLRFLSAVASVTFSLKLFDLHVGSSQGARPGFARFGTFLLNVFSLVDRRIDAGPDPQAGSPWRGFVLASGTLVIAAGVAAAVARADWTRHGFALEHTVKVVTFFLVLVPFTHVAGAIWRAAGGSGREFMNNPFAARTPADFWRRYNRPVHEFLEHDVFRFALGSGGSEPRRGRNSRRPAWARLRAVILVFVLSAAIHEYVVAVPIGRVQGYQTAFFLLQGLAVGATQQVKPRGVWAVAWTILTFIFSVASGVLFFASLNHVVPFYSNAPPLWDE